MKRWTTLMVLVLGLGSYAIFAQPLSAVPGQGMGRGMGGGMMPQGGGMMGRGMMQGGMGCPACGAWMQPSIAATSAGGLVVAVAGRLIKYDASLKKVSEANIDVDGTAMHQRVQQMMQNCPMMQQMRQQGQN